MRSRLVTALLHTLAPAESKPWDVPEAYAVSGLQQRNSSAED